MLVNTDRIHSAFSLSERKIFRFLDLFRLYGGAMLANTDRIHSACALSKRKISRFLVLVKFCIERVRGPCVAHLPLSLLIEEKKEVDTMAMLEAKELRFDYTYENEAPQIVLRGIDLTIEKGSFVALLGHNGCGKSTLAKHFNALLLPTGGKMLVEGMDTADEENTYPIRSRVGMVLQNPDNQLVSTIVEEDVAFGPENLGLPPAEIRQRVDEALAAVDMTAYKDHSPHKLSGGQKQRIAIAGVLAMHPDCLVLDEPTAMLDPKGRREVVETIAALNRQKGITVVLITHHMDEAAQAQRVIVLSKGQVAADGTPREVFSKVDLLHSIRLAAPETVELCNALNKHGFALPLDRLSPEECAQAIYEQVKP